MISHSKFSKKNQPTIPCLSMGYLKNKGKMKTFPNKNKNWNNFLAIDPLNKYSWNFFRLKPSDLTQQSIRKNGIPVKANI